MVLSQNLLEILACPQCKGELMYSVQEFRLICNSCKLAYRIENNIPILLTDQALSI